MKIQILLYNGFDELDAIAPFEVLRMATRHTTDLHVEMVTLDGASEITAQHVASLNCYPSLLHPVPIPQLLEGRHHVRA